MGHILNNTLQDVLRPLPADGRATRRCWIPGTDHAGIATQNVVEQALLKEGKTPPRPRARGVPRAGLGVEGAVRRHDHPAAPHASAARATGSASASPWTRRSPRAVREAFVRLYEKGLIYRGQLHRQLVPALTTRRISDDEVDHTEHDGKL
ncbi:MAG: class I tRNA ligase family protein [Ignavibacteriales bacterium]|nr:class I tRNA ligase family protein [Ignavibacteriales bacterium]